MEKKMNKNILLLLSAVLLSTPLGATENPLQDSLPGLLQKDTKLRPYVKDFISSSNFPGKEQVLTSIESPSLFKKLNFHELIPEIPGRNAWVPQTCLFSNNTLQQLLKPYSPSLSPSDEHMIFLANILYEAGTKVYDQINNTVYIEYAASIGHANAQRKMFSIDFKLGKLVESGNYLLCSAAQGNADALLTLSEVYQGFWQIGIPSDLNIARLLCQEAANRGNIDALYRIEVSTLTEGFFNSQRNYQQGIRKAKELADNNNSRATK